MSLLRKVVFGILIFTFVIVNSASLVTAQETGVWYNQTYDEWVDKVYMGGEDDEVFGERYTAAQVQWILYSLIYIIQNTSAGPAAKCLLSDKADAVACLDNLEITVSILQEASSSNDKSLAGLIFEDRPLSGITSVRNIGRELHVVPEAQAQTTGFGFNALDPIQDMWKGVRDAVYGLFVVVVLVLAFMIMFRVKISPQVAISVQSALPRVAVALVLVTFSYAIAGLMVDLMYVIIALVSAALAAINGGNNVVHFFNLLTKGPLDMGIWGYLVFYYSGFIVALFTLIFASNNVLVALGWTLLMVIMMIVMILVLLWVGMKIVWMLFKAMAIVLLSTLIAPLQILLGVVAPKMGFGAWLRNYLANLIVFPVAGLLLYLSVYFCLLSISYAFADIGVVKFTLWILGEEQFTKPLGAGWPPLLATGDAAETASLVFLGVSFVIVTIIPKTTEMIKAMIRGQEFNYGSGIGQALGPVSAPAGFVARAGLGAGNEALKGWFTKQLPSIEGGVNPAKGMREALSGRRGRAGRGRLK